MRSLNRTTRGKVREIGATGPHHECHAKASLNIGWGGRHGSVETHRQARLCGTYLGNMTKGRSRRASELTSTGRADADSHMRAVWIGARVRSGPCRLRRPAAGNETGAQDRQASPDPPANGKAPRHGVSANGLTRCMQARLPRARGECAHRRAFKVHVDASTTHWKMETTMGDDETSIKDAIASFIGTVTRCPPGHGTAPDAKERGQAQFKCVCGHRGTMPYPKLFKRLRRRRPMLLRCQRCGRVLR